MTQTTQLAIPITESLEAIAKTVVTEANNELAYRVSMILGSAMVRARTTGENVVFSTRGNNAVRLEGKLHFNGPHREYTISPDGNIHYKEFDGEGFLPKVHETTQVKAAIAYVDSLGFPQF